MRPGDAANIVAEHFITYNWMKLLGNTNIDPREREADIARHMDGLREKGGEDFGTVVRAFGDVYGPEQVIDSIAESLA